MGEILDMAKHISRKLDCQGEAVDLREHFDGKAGSRKSEAALALSTCIRLMQAEFGDQYAMSCLTNEVLRVKGRK